MFFQHKLEIKVCIEEGEDPRVPGTGRLVAHYLTRRWACWPGEFFIVFPNQNNCFSSIFNVIQALYVDALAPFGPVFPIGLFICKEGMIMQKLCKLIEGNVGGRFQEHLRYSS